MAKPIDAFDKPVASTAGDVGSEGTSGAAARADHKHDRTGDTGGGGVTTGDLPTGKKDNLTASGTSATWNLTYIPMTDTLHVYNGAAVLEETTDYSLSGKTVSVTSGIASGDVLTGRYLYKTNAQPSTVVTLNTTSGAVNSGSSVTITIPAGAHVGDFMVLRLSTGTTAIPSTPSGWTYYTQSGVSAPSLGIAQYVFYRWCVGGDPGSNVVIGLGGVITAAATISCYGSVDTTFPISTSIHSVGTTSATTYLDPAAIPASNGCLLEHGVGVKVTTGTNPGALSWDAGVTSDRTDSYSSGSVGFGLAHESVNSGSTPRHTLTTGNACEQDAVSLVLNASGVAPLGVNAYANQVLSLSPQGLWMLGDASVMTDSSTNARNGTYPGGVPSTAATMINSATSNLTASFAGGSKHAEVAYGSWLTTNAFSIEFWLTTSVSGTIIERIDPGDGIQVWIAHVIAAGYLRLTYYNAAGGLDTSTNSNIIIADGNKHHVVISHSGTDVSYIVNGGLDRSLAATSGTYTGALGHGGLRVRDTTTHKVQGVAFYNYGLTVAQAQANFAAGMVS